jgi:hypothetical protein
MAPHTSTSTGGKANPNRYPNSTSPVKGVNATDLNFDHIPRTVERNANALT